VVKGDRGDPLLVHVGQHMGAAALDVVRQRSLPRGAQESCKRQDADQAVLAVNDAQAIDAVVVAIPKGG
jgi:hypothetical protein